MLSWLATKLRVCVRWLVRPPAPAMIDLNQLVGGRRRLRELEFQQWLDRESKVIRTSRQCRTMPRRSVVAIVVRLKVKRATAIR